MLLSDISGAGLQITLVRARIVWVVTKFTGTLKFEKHRPRALALNPALHLNYLINM